MLKREELPDHWWGVHYPWGGPQHKRTWLLRLSPLAISSKCQTQHPHPPGDRPAALIRTDPHKSDRTGATIPSRSPALVSRRCPHQEARPENVRLSKPTASTASSTSPFNCKIEVRRLRRRVHRRQQDERRARFCEPRKRHHIVAVGQTKGLGRTSNTVVPDTQNATSTAPMSNACCPPAFANEKSSGRRLGDRSIEAGILAASQLTAEFTAGHVSGARDDRRSH